MKITLNRVLLIIVIIGTFWVYIVHEANSYQIYSVQGGIILNASEFNNTNQDTNNRTQSALNDINNTDNKTSSALTAMNITENNLANFLNITFAGSSAITTLGTIGTGVWQGSQIVDAYLVSGAKWVSLWNNQNITNQQQASANIGINNTQTSQASTNNVTFPTYNNLNKTMTSSFYMSALTGNLTLVANKWAIAQNVTLPAGIYSFAWSSTIASPSGTAQAARCVLGYNNTNISSDEAYSPPNASTVAFINVNNIGGATLTGGNTIVNVTCSSTAASVVRNETNSPAGHIYNASVITALRIG